SSRRRHTRWPRDWSSDVCSSDLFHSDWLGSTRYLSDSTGNNFPNALRYDAFGNRSATGGTYDPTPFQFAGGWGYQAEFATGPEQIGRASCRERGEDTGVVAADDK